MSGSIRPQLPDPEPGFVDASSWQDAPHIQNLAEDQGEVAGAKCRKQCPSVAGSLRISQRNGVSFVQRRTVMHARLAQNKGADEMASIPRTSCRAIWLLFAAVIAFLAAGTATTTGTVVKPLCILPLVEKSPLCVTDSPSIHEQHSFLQADYPALIQAQKNVIEKLLDVSVGASAFSWDIRKMQMAVNDLATIAHHSNLNHRNLISESLLKLAHGARSASIGLQRLGSETQHAIDGIVAVNEHVLAKIQDARGSELSSNMLMDFFCWVTNGPSIDDVVLKTYTDSIDYLSAMTDRLIIKAQRPIEDIQDLESILSTMHATVTREEPFALMFQEELLEGLWTALGGNEYHIPPLRGTEEYHKGALRLAFTSLHALHEFSSTLEALGQNTVAVEPKVSPIPVEIHTNSIRTGLRDMSRLWSNAWEKQVALETKF